MLLSTVFEGYRWTGTAVVGVVFAVLGNSLALRWRLGPQKQQPDLAGGVDVKPLRKLWVHGPTNSAAQCPG